MKHWYENDENEEEKDKHEEDEQDKIMRKIRHDNQTGRWLTTFRGAWHRDSAAFAVGSMAQPRQLEVYAADPHSSKRGVARVMSLQDPEHFRSVHSRLAFHPSLDYLVGVNSSGRAGLFWDGDC